MANEISPAATAAATSAASGLNRTRRLPMLQTPDSASYPSELKSPHPGTGTGIGTPTFIVNKDDSAVKTPITTPTAYYDFLKAMSPVLMSPPTSGSNARFAGTDKASTTPSTLGPGEGIAGRRASATDASGIRPNDMSPPTTGPGAVQPTLSRHTSSDSTTTSYSTTSSSSASTEFIRSTTSSRPETPRIIIPHSPYLARPSSARESRRSQIAHSPYSSMTPSSLSAHSMHSPYGHATTPWSASFSSRNGLPPQSTTMASPAGSAYHTTTRDDTRGNMTGKVCVRHVVTRTVTYCRTPLDPAPKGKRRRVEEPLVKMDEEQTEETAETEEEKVKEEKEEES